MSNRQAYNKLQAQVRHEQAERLQRFKESQPERYAELLAQAKREVAEEPSTPPRPITRYSPVRTRALSIEEIDQLVYRPTERHYLIQAKDKWGDEHRFFESTTFPPPDEDELLALLAEKHPRYDLTEIIDVTPCTCPACTRRHSH